MSTIYSSQSVPEKGAPVQKYDRSPEHTLLFTFESPSPFVMGKSPGGFGLLMNQNPMTILTSIQRKLSAIG